VIYCVTGLAWATADWTRFFLKRRISNLPVFISKVGNECFVVPQTHSTGITHKFACVFLINMSSQHVIRVRKGDVTLGAFIFAPVVTLDNTNSSEKAIGDCDGFLSSPITTRTASIRGF